MANPTRVEVNCTTGEVLEIELTDAEVAAEAAFRIELDAQMSAERAALAAKEALKESARAKLVAGTPLTEEEAAIII